MKPQKLGYERRYSDDSGVEAGVYYDESQKGTDGLPVIKIHAIDTIEVDRSNLEFLIDALCEIRDKTQGDA